MQIRNQIYQPPQIESAVNVQRDLLVALGSAISRDCIAILGKHVKTMERPLRLIETTDTEGKPVTIVTNVFDRSAEHAPNEVVPRIRMLWDSIPYQLTKENKKFIYGIIKDGARAKGYEMAMLWLTDCGLVHKVQRVTAP